MSASIIITVCILLLLAYFFDITSSKTKIPSIILLLILGWFVKQGTVLLHISIPNLSPILPVVGTIGLILIVLEGSLELELKKSKWDLVGKSTIVALVPMLLLSFGLGYAYYYYGNISFKDGLANAIPMAVISSAVAITSAKNLITTQKEFITYESSLSDIFGVLFFNFITLHTVIDAITFGEFFLDLIIIFVVSFVATLGLAYLLSKITHRVKFAPIIILIILIYFISKEYHLPALFFILFIGLFLGNLNEMSSFFFMEKLRPEILEKEVYKFRELITEFTFLIRALFFLLFGFVIKTAELLNPKTIIWAVLITVSIFIIRGIFLKIVKLPLNPLLFIAPRGLITVLLFLSVPISQATELSNKSVIIQVIILTAFIMMIGFMVTKKLKED
ncbi:cation:proton antiporter domain-containing protein [Flavobacterium soyangense]|uniref:Cation:proton antiporter n=1 Tax=Flavobacterium soyangense TaxID=2023265 RepID=A0A930U555_9FLAO|nr:cation:proton antiporter [Flavobacterium soyangense]MBF2707053.1 cation:proton antiporter [Flavobacterium soyangense]